MAEGPAGVSQSEHHSSQDPCGGGQSEIVVEELQSVTSAVKQLQQAQLKTTDLLSSKLGDDANLDLQELRKLNEKLTEQLGEEVSRLSGLRKSSSFPVEVVAIEGARELVESLRNAGFNAIAHEELFDDGPKSPNDQAAVWVGKHVPWAVVKAVVLASRSVWPHLKYLHLSGRDGAPDYINYELFIGGSTKSATGMFNCQPWNDGDFRKLGAVKYQQELHGLILGKMG